MTWKQTEEEIRRLLHLRKSGAQGCQLSEALERGKRERIRIADESDCGDRGSRNTSLGKSETWTSDSGAASTMKPSAEGLLNYTVKPEVRYATSADGKPLSMAGSGQLEIVVEQPGGPKTISLGKVLHVPKLERHLISEPQRR